MTQDPDTTPSDTTPSPGRGRRGGLLAGAIVCGLFCAAALPVILSGYNDESKTRAGYDQTVFHLHAIRTFARQWPRPDLSDYRAATSPGYHLALAAADRAIHGGPPPPPPEVPVTPEESAPRDPPDVRALRGVNLLFTVALLMTLAVVVGRRVGAWHATAMCLPLACGVYVFASGVWLQPDNAAWLLTLAVLLLALRPRVDAWTYLGGGALLAALVFVRQSNLWPAAVLWLAAWLGGDGRLWRGGRHFGAGALGAPGDAEPEGSFARRRLTRAALMLLCTLPAFAVVAWLARLWGGLVPPYFQQGSQGAAHALAASTHEGGNAAAPAMVLFVFGLFGLFFLTYLLPHARRAFRDHRRAAAAVLLGSLAAGAVVALLPETTFNREAGRMSGWWVLAGKLPVVADRSPFVVAFAVAGAGVLALLWLAAAPRDRLIYLATFACFTAAQAANAMAWPRYYEGLALTLLPIACARLPRTSDRPRWAALGPLALAALLAAVTVINLT